MSVLDYLSLLVNSMTSIDEVSTASLTGSTRYMMAILDDVGGEYGGPIVKVVKISRNASTENIPSAYEIDIGAPAQSTPVVDFQIRDNQAYAMQLKFTEELRQPTDQYRIDDTGKLSRVYAPLVSQSGQSRLTYPWDKTWWTQVTQYPIKATLRVRGLLKPALLMSYLRVNTWFYGRKHLSSGLYVITKQRDSISGNGFATELDLLRVGGDPIDN